MATATKGKQHPTEVGKSSTTPRRGWISGLTQEVIEQEGSTLLAMLFAKAHTEGLQIQTLATEKLGVHPSYLAQLRSRAKSVETISHDFARACAHYLGIPLIAVLVAAGQLKEEDFREAVEDDAMIANAVNFILRDPHVGLIVPEKLLKQDKDLQRAFVILYEMATGKKLLGESRVSADKLAVFAREVPPPFKGMKRKQAPKKHLPSKSDPEALRKAIDWLNEGRTED